jgi:hypothetical protein
MAEFLVELYAARDDEAGVRRRTEQARLAAREVTREGTPVSFVRSIFVPEDEICFALFEAETAEAVSETARRAGLEFDRVVQTRGQSEGRSG